MLEICNQKDNLATKEQFGNQRKLNVRDNQCQKETQSNFILFLSYACCFICMYIFTTLFNILWYKQRTFTFIIN